MFLVVTKTSPPKNEKDREPRIEFYEIYSEDVDDAIKAMAKDIYFWHRKKTKCKELHSTDFIDGYIRKDIVDLVTDGVFGGNLPKTTYSNTASAYAYYEPFDENEEAIYWEINRLSGKIKY
jgi:hypothetical protein